MSKRTLIAALRNSGIEGITKKGTVLVSIDHEYGGIPVYHAIVNDVACSYALIFDKSGDLVVSPPEDAE